MYALIARLSEVVRVISSYAIPKAVGRGTSIGQNMAHMVTMMNELTGPGSLGYVGRVD